jgi:hypothetical protein
MAAVYLNSYLTVAAAHAKDGSGGCFNRRASRRHIPVDFMAQDGTMGQVLAFLLPPEKEVDSESYLELSSEPLSKRA